jgi:hypothetical protein
MRKLQRRNGTPKKKRLIRKYKKQQCAFMILVEKNGYVNEEPRRCKKGAVGKSTLCKVHGGNPIVHDSLVRSSERSIHSLLKSKYDPAFHPMLYLSCAKEGMSEVEIAAHLEISILTLHKWAETHKEFAMVFEIGEAMHEAWYIREGKNNLRNPRFQTGLYKHLQRTN